MRQEICLAELRVSNFAPKVLVRTRVVYKQLPLDYPGYSHPSLIPELSRHFFCCAVEVLLQRALLA